MKLPLYQIDAFARVPFEGNPAAICPLQYWLSDELMQQIAMENSLSETAFFVAEEEAYRIRWFTPSCEVDLCGHATLAAAFVLWQFLGYSGDCVRFNSLAGPLAVTHEGDRLQLDFPSRPIKDEFEDARLLQALGDNVRPLWLGHDQQRVLLELETEQALRRLQPKFSALRELPDQVFYVTARSQQYDFVCRVFAPAKGIDEDPVTGSAYTSLAPYWAGKLNKQNMIARQISARGGDVFLNTLEDRVLISGHAVCVMQGELWLPSN